jgi:subtilisin family serine protease
MAAQDNQDNQDSPGGSAADAAYYYVGTRRVPLFLDPHVFVVRFEHETRVDHLPTRQAVRTILAGAAALAFLPRDGLSVYRAPSAASCVERLRQQDGVAQVYQACGHGPGGDPLVPTARLLAKFRAEPGVEKILSTLELLGLRILEPLPYAAPNGFLLGCAPGVHGLGAIAAANALVEQGVVLFAEPDLVQARHFRSAELPLPAPAWLAREWHLHACGVPDAWRDNRGSPAVRIAILDDGVDTAHPEFAGAVATGQPRLAAQFDFASGSHDAAPKTYADRHGTACAGVAAAAGIKAAGVAPGCRLVVARTPDFLAVSEEARMFEWAVDVGADVLSCSWGPADGSGVPCPLPTATRLAIRYCLQQGRGGKGMPVFWAAGNGNEPIDDDGYAANPDVMAIGACSAAGLAAPYSDYGARLFACAPSSGGPGESAILTTDRLGPAGYGPAGPGDPASAYTDRFGGTSAAAPLAAGIAALMLSANPALSAADIRNLLRQSAVRLGDPLAYDAAGHSAHFGYGRLDAARAVQAARAVPVIVQPGPAITGPETWTRTDPPPRFHVNPGTHRYYVVEVAADPELFDSLRRRPDRNGGNFYGSWSDQPFQTNPTYILPGAAWAQLRNAPRLWYRVGTSASPDDYVDYAVSTTDDQAGLAPSIDIRAGIGTPPRARERRRTITELMGLLATGESKPDIEGPLLWDPLLGSPAFRIEPGLAQAYAVELCNDPLGFGADPAGGPPGRGYFSSGWIVATAAREDGTRVGFEAYVLPLAAWDALLGTACLYYRMTVYDERQPRAGPVYAMDLTSSAPGPLASGAVLPGRADEALWRRYLVPVQDSAATS